MEEYGGSDSEKYYAYDHKLPCRNPNCKSHGKPHPNCKCYGGHGSEDHFAKGGSVCAANMPHMKGCEYFAEGGMAEPMPEPAHPSVTIGHAAIGHGLLGLLKNVGKASMQDPEKHSRLLTDARDQHKYRKDPSGVPLKKTTGTRLADHLNDGNHDDAAELMHGHPTVGGASKSGVKAILARLHPALLESEPDPEAMRGASDYLHSAIKGNDLLQGRINNMIGPHKKVDRVKINEESREQLKKHLQDLNEDPEKMLDIGGKIGHYLPDHAAALGALSSTAVQYLSSLKPTQKTTGPLDPPIPPDKVAVEQWNRTLDIAQEPLIVLDHVREGTVIPQDLKTLGVLYPGLLESMVSKAGEALIEAKTKDKEIPYRQRMGLGLLLGQPIDGTMTPYAMQAIMQSNAQQAQVNANEKQKQGGGGKISATQLKAIEKEDSLYETGIEKRQMNKKS